MSTDTINQEDINNRDVVKDANVRATYPMMNAGIAMPYLAIFNAAGIPIYNPHTKRPLGTNITQFSYKYEVEKDTEANLDIQVAHYSVVDLTDIQEKAIIYLQWGYIYPEGRTVSSKPKKLQIKEAEYTFDSQGTNIKLKCKALTFELTHMPQYVPNNPEDGRKFSQWLDDGLDKAMGIIIRKFKPKNTEEQ